MPRFRELSIGNTDDVNVAWFQGSYRLRNDAGDFGPQVRRAFEGDVDVFHGNWRLREASQIQTSRFIQLSGKSGRLGEGKVAAEHLRLPAVVERIYPGVSNFPSCDVFKRTLL